MRKIAISEEKFKIIMDATKNMITKDECRPVLKYILLKIDGQKLTAYAVDGYRASKVVVELDKSTDESFECLIKPIKVKGGHSRTVTIEFDGKRTCVCVQEKFGEIKYTFDMPSWQYIDIEKVYRESQEHDLDLYFSADFIADACKSIEDYSTQGVKLQVSKDPNRPMIICGKDRINNIQFEQLIFPIKHIENN